MTEATFFKAALAVLALNGVVVWMFFRQELRRKGERARTILVATAVPAMLVLLLLIGLLLYIFLPTASVHLFHILAVLLIPMSALVAYGHFRTPLWRERKRFLTMLGVFLLIVAADDFWYSRNFELPFPKTVYAEDYTKRNFLKIQPGMSYDQVIELLGEPLATQYSMVAVYFFPDSGQLESYSFWTPDIEQDRERFEAAKRGPLPDTEEAEAISARGKPDSIRRNSWIYLDYSKAYYSNEYGSWARTVVLDEETRKVSQVIAFVALN